MGERGPAPLPANVHRLSGNASKKPLAALLEGIHPEVVVPRMPAYLVKGARKEWKRLAPKLEKLGLITDHDLVLFAMYCQEAARIEWAEEKIAKLNEADPEGEAGYVEKTPNGYRVQSAYLQILRKSQEVMPKLASQFGLSPAMRTRVTASDNQGDLFAGTDSEQPELPKVGWGSFN